MYVVIFVYEFVDDNLIFDRNESMDDTLNESVDDTLNESMDDSFPTWCS